jgi:hypothetical protein
MRVSTEYRFRCDGPECERFHETNYPVSAAFILVREPGDHGAATEHHFCSWDCVLRFAETFEPPEVPAGGDDA